MQWKWWARRSSQERTSADRLAEEPEAWLAGTYVDWLLSHRRLVPTWAWLNPAAHLDRAGLERLAARAPDAGNGWGLTCYLAGEVVAAADREGVDVRELQQSRLVPLELELYRRAGTVASPRRAELAPLVAAALGSRARS